jgi:rhamnosyl/mannosyltransferase
MLLPEARRLPWIIHWHSDVVPSKIDRRLMLAYQIYKPFEQKLLGHAAAIIATSKPYLATSKALAPWRSKCVTVPLGLDPERLPFPAEEQLARTQRFWNTDKLKVLAIGRLTYYKGHEFLINAVSSLENAKAVIVGQGERRKELHDLINAHGLRAKVVLAGGLPPPELNALLATCDCLCLPSLERTEAFGLVLLEAMRFGKAIVASDIAGSGVGFVVQDRVTGQLVPVGDSNGLAQALDRLATDPDLVARLGKAGIARFAEHFHIQRVALEIKEIYTGVSNNLLHS